MTNNFRVIKSFQSSPVELPSIISSMSPLTPNFTPGASVNELAENHWRLSIPKGEAGAYRLAQLDDYTGFSRKQFPWQAPLCITLQCRASAAELPGTWGFGLWNDPFSLSMGFGGGVRRLPALPKAAWFFFASAPNHLSLYDDQPGCGALAMSMRSLHIPPLLLAPAAIGLPLLLWRWTAKGMRRLARLLVQQDTSLMVHDPANWHEYALVWETDRVTLRVDGESVLESKCSPMAPLGLVLWLDNQYAALPPAGRLAYGTLANPAAWIEIKDLRIEGN